MTTKKQLTKQEKAKGPPTAGEFCMGSIAASGPREPTQRPRPIPPAVRGAVLLMVYEGADLCAAAKKVGIRGDTLRRWLHRGEFIGFLRRERRAYREALTANTEHVLQEIRSTSENFMARLGAVRELERLADESPLRHTDQAVSPGVVIRVLNIVQGAKAGQAIEAKVPLIDSGDRD
jgi:hypothetical protein